MKKWVVLGLVVAAVWWALYEKPAKWRGIPARGEPVQITKDLAKPFQQGKYTLTPLANYTVKAVVLSACRYRFDEGADLVPVDLALGWGPMSVADVINSLKFSQSGRWYEYSWRGEAPLNPHDIAVNSANTHCIPANANIRRQLLSVTRHDLVTLEGCLVEIDGPKGFHRKSSLTRDDRGGGACEILYVTQITRQKL
ncbi:MAG: hypothetical protein QM790_13750 [Nibricoccus sp.]